MHSLSILPCLSSSRKELARLCRDSTWVAALLSKKTGKKKKCLKLCFVLPDDMTSVVMAELVAYWYEDQLWNISSLASLRLSINLKRQIFKDNFVEMFQFQNQERTDKDQEVVCLSNEMLVGLPIGVWEKERAVNHRDSTHIMHTMAWGQVSPAATKTPPPTQNNSQHGAASFSPFNFRFPFSSLLSKVPIKPTYLHERQLRRSAGGQGTVGKTRTWPRSDDELG